MSSAEDITKKAKSNLAFAFACLPKDRRADMVTFYAFCRVIDDIADCPNTEAETKTKDLDEWKRCFQDSTNADEGLQKEILEIRDRYQIDTSYFLELIEGCASDIDNRQRFGSWEDLSQYTYRVACCVGLISVRIFGCTHPDSDKYAIALGHALQLTNILRDVGEDLDDNLRVYLPLTDMNRFQYTERDLVGRVHDGRFISMMNYHADRAEAYYQEAASLVQPCDKQALRSAEAMRHIYHGILEKMRADNFRIFDQRYTLSKPKKVWLLLSTMMGLR